jgi:hypothetical protein
MKMANTNRTRPTWGREDIAQKVFTWAGAGLLTISIIIIFTGVAAFILTSPDKRSTEDIRTLALTVFNTLVPMFGTWVGTVIAFYFARENYEAAAQSTRELVGQLSDDRLKQISIRQIWIPVGQIVAAQIAIDRTEADITIEQLRSMLDEKVSRVPVWDQDRVVKYILHESLIYKYLALYGAEISSKDGQPRPANLRDLLSRDDFRKFATAISFIGQSDTLADAKRAMEAKPNCRDVFATNAGQGSAPVLGWITNIEIARYSTANA